jgi:sRNA-binding carbon storage regulator CsrA
MRYIERAANEGLTVGSVQIEILEVRCDSVKLGINDPHALPQYREEVLFLDSGNGGPQIADESDMEFAPFIDVASEQLVLSV